MCRILRVWKLKTWINSSHVLDLEAPPLTDLRNRVGPLKQTKHPRIGGGPRLGWAGLAGWLAQPAEVEQNQSYSIRCAPARRPS